MDKTMVAVFGKFIPDFTSLLTAAKLDAARLDRIEWGKGDANGYIPQNSFHDGSLGVSRREENVFVYRGRQWMKLKVHPESDWKSNYAYSQPSHSDGHPLGDAIESGDTFVVVDRYERDDWPGRELVDEREFVIWEIGAAMTDEERRIRWACEILMAHDLTAYFTSASEIQREYYLADSTVRKACEEKRIRCWRIGRDWLVYRPDAHQRWHRKLEFADSGPDLSFKVDGEDAE